MTMLGTATGCGGPSPEDEAPPAPKPAPKLCVRCKAPAAIAVRVTAWCNDCFHRSFHSRFNKAMDPARVVSSEGMAVLEGRKAERRRNGPAAAQGEGKEPAKVLLAFSGGASSRALLELVKTSYFAHLSPSSSPSSAPSSADAPAQAPAQEAEGGGKKKKPSKKHGLARAPAFRELEILLVDESEVEGSGEDRSAEIRRIVSSAAPWAKLTILPLSSVFSLPSSSSSAQPSTLTFSPSLPLSPSPASSSSSPSSPSATPQEQLRSLLAPLSPTARSTLHRSLLSTLLRSHAREVGAEILLLGDSATRVAVNTLSGMAQGRGFSAGEEVAGFYVDRSGGEPLLVVRPLALSLAKEIAYYARTTPTAGGKADGKAEGKGEGSESLTMRRPETSVPAEDGGKKKEVELKKRGVGALVEDFILSLDADFPSTVSTVVRTAHKLGLRSADAALRAWEAAGARVGGGERGGEGESGKEGGKEQGEEVEGSEGCLPAQRTAAAWRAAITISDLQAALAPTLLPSSASSSAPVPPPRSSKLEPYKPSAAHLLPTASSDPPAPAPAPPPASASDAAPPAPLAPLATTSAQTAADPPLGLANSTCYACLLSLLEPSSSLLSRRGAPTSVPLPPYIAAAVEARRAKELREKDREEGVMGRREVSAKEGLRGEVRGFLLEDEGEGEEE
ncbi:Cytoplasmic tRNA 2-thiolation protein 2 [Rhodosporidiobolus nylandii]